jgi:ribosome-associated toxin RatA of RatAB toxin-antitoxin module
MAVRSFEIWRQRVADRLPRLLWLVVLGAAAAAFARPAEVSVIAIPQDAGVQVTARALVRAPAELIWQTLTDYDHLSEFVPGMVSSHVVSHQGSQLIIEQKGGAHLWFFSYPIRVTVTSTEHPYEGIDVRLLQGNLRRLEGSYRIEPQPDGTTELSWTGMIEPDSPLPAFISNPILRRSISEQFTGMVREIERRADRWSARSALTR